MEALSTVAIGAVIGIAVLYSVFNEQPVPALVLAAAALGAVLTSAVRQAVSAAVAASKEKGAVAR